MATIPLPPDFSAFLRLLSEHEVRYLLIGGYAVGYHGYVRATADMDVWVSRERVNAERLVAATIMHLPVEEFVGSRSPDHRSASSYLHRVAPLPRS